MSEEEERPEGPRLPACRKPTLVGEPFRRIGRPEAAPLRVIIWAGTLGKICDQLSSDMERELGGVLVGEACLWEGCTYVEVRSCLAACTPSHGPVHFTFTAETWIALDRAMDDEPSGRYMVGWYHSHPRLGVFFSQQDGDVHRVVFNQPWHVALVIDPSTGEAAFFGWAEGRPVHLPGYYIVEEAGPAKEELPHEPPEGVSGPPPEAPPSTSGPVEPQGARPSSPASPVSALQACGGASGGLRKLAKRLGLHCCRRCTSHGSEDGATS